MNLVKIIRIETDPTEGTFGVMTINGVAACVTLEPYSRDNANNVSCIPTGQYICKRYSSPKYPNTFEVTGVQNRSYILFHPGNIAENSAGCILLGSEFGMLGDDHAILESSKAFNRFMKYFDNTNQFKLTIVEEF